MPEQQQFVEQIFGEVLDLLPAERNAYLERACQGSPQLRRGVEELLLQHERAGSFLASPLLHAVHGQGPFGTLETSQSQRDLRGSPRPRFGAGDSIAGRFHVVRFIARGGMGEVYEVEDRLLQGAHVGLKMILPEIAADATGSHRFEQEVLLARRINHPNLCPIYEIFHCQEPAPAFLFLTMKLLEGETLAARLRTARPFTRDEAAHICRQLLSGVAAIHAAGVIHRDLKPNNIMLQRTGETVSVSIMDFGLARLHESEATIVQPGAIAGTPGYLAPELIAGQRPTEATDLFALGVVLHQVLTGEYPSETRNRFSVPSRPSVETAGISPDLVRAVRDFLSDDPEQRCRRFAAILSNTSMSHGTATLPRAGAPLLTRRRFALAAAASACALGGAAAWRRDTLYNLLHPLPSKRFVAVINWPPLADERIRPVVLSLIDAMADELARAEAYDRNFFVAAQKTIGDMTTFAQLNEVRQSLGANLVLATSAKSSGKDLLVSLHVLDPASGQTMRTRDLRASAAEQFALPQRTVLAAAELLGLAEYKLSDRANSAGTNSPTALAAYQAAEAQMKKPNNTGLEEAIADYKQAVDLDRNFAEAHAGLALAYLKFYYEHRDPISLNLASANLDTALTLQPDLIEGHVVRGLIHQARGNPHEALHEFGVALSVDPSNTRTMTYQGQVYWDMSRWKEAEDTYKRVIKLRPNYWLAYNELGQTYNSQALSRQALEASRTASLLNPNNALVLNNVASAYFQLGDLTAALLAVNRSLKLSRSDAALTTRADIFRAQARYDESVRSALEAAEMVPNSGFNWLEVGDSYLAIPHCSKQGKAAFLRGMKAQSEMLMDNPKDGSGWMLLVLLRLKSGATDSMDDLIARAEKLGAIDMYSQLYKVRILELLHRREEALSTVFTWMERGLTSFQVNVTPDLDQLRRDPRYIASIADHPSTPIAVQHSLLTFEETRSV